LQPAAGDEGAVSEEPLVHRASAIEFFRDLVDGALSHQHLQAGELTSYYVVNLLAGFLHRPGGDNEALALRFGRALAAGGLEQRSGLKEVGDVSLFVSGFFSDSLGRSLVDVDYYIRLGGSAYQALSRRDEDQLSPVFAELAEKFAAFVDVLSEVSERTSCTSNQDLLRLYERWLKTGGRRSGQLLVERGVVPNASVRLKRVH